MREDLPAALQRILARDRDVAVRLNVLRRKRKPVAAVLARLAKDPDPKVRTLALRAAGVAPSHLASPDQPLAERLSAVRWGISIAVERILARDPSAEVRLKLAVTRHPRKCGRSPSIDAEALALLVRDKSAKVRDAATHLEPYPKATKKPPS
jgi:hypothetical protein